MLKRIGMLLTLLAATLVFAGHVDAREPDAKKLQVFILAGQSNMVGHSSFITLPRLFVDERSEVKELAKLVFKPGETVTPEDVDAYIVTQMTMNELRQKLRKKEITGEAEIAKANEKIAELQAKHEALGAAIKAKTAVSDRVFITSIADRNVRSGPLGVGYGASADKLGPELGFGMSMAKRIDSPILIIKTSWGGKSLNYDFRPPSAGEYELDGKQKDADNKDEIKAKAGHFYREMTKKVDEVLADVGKYHPQYDEKAGYEIAGFVWFQGFNDQFSDAFRDNYEANMITFIKDVRKQFNAPNMPFVIGVLGTGRTAEKVAENKVSLGQRAAAKHPAFKDNVAAVESYEVYDNGAFEVYSKGWAQHYREWAAVGSDRPYHYLGSGKFFVRFGDRLAEAMKGLIEKQ